MVHALEEIHRLLRSGGTLIDIHPVPYPPTVQIVRGDEVLFAEPKRDIADEDQDVLAADRALDDVVERGLFKQERNEEFDFTSYAPSVQQLREFWDDYGEYDDTPKSDNRLAQEEDVYSRAETLRREAGTGAEAALHERTKIARLTPGRG